MIRNKTFFQMKISDFVMVQPLGGLANRMRNIAAAQKMATYLNKKLLVLWVRNNELNEKFEHLFEPVPFKVINDRQDSFLQHFLWGVLFKTNYFSIVDDFHIINSGIQDSLNMEWAEQYRDKRVIIVGYQDINHKYDLSIFKPINKIEERCPFRKSDQIIGIHIRRTDNVNSIMHSPDELFVNFIEKELSMNPHSRFFLSTDDKNVETLIREKFKNHIIIIPKTSLDRNLPIAIQEGLLDMYSLSQCSKIIGSYDSSFSYNAALWGGTDFSIVKNN